MKKATKKKQIEDLQTVVAAQWRQINKLKLVVGRLTDDWPDDDHEQADHDAVIAILDSKEPKLKVLDQSVFDDEPPHLKWAAVEEDGSVYLFAKKPFIDLCKWAAGVDEVEVYIGDDYDASDWQNSLIERDKVELTGSDLCREVLKTRRAVARVSDISDFEAADLGSDNASTAVLRQCDDGLFYTTNGARRWFYAVLINNQGEPLTAAEVEL